MIEYTAKFYSLQALYKTIKFFSGTVTSGWIIGHPNDPANFGWVGECLALQRYNKNDYIYTTFI